MVGIVTAIAMLSAAVVLVPIKQASAQDTDLDCFNQPDGDYVCILTKIT
jgi:hypothetical protein